MLLGALQEGGVDRGVVGAVDQEALAVQAVHRRLRHGRSGDLHLVRSEDGDGDAVLRADHDGLRLPLPEVGVVLVQPVEPGCALLVVAEVERRVGAGDRLEPVLGPQHGGSDMAHGRLADRDEQHVAGLRVDRAVGVDGGLLEALVEADLDGLAVDLVDEVALLVVGGDLG